AWGGRFLGGAPGLNRRGDDPKLNPPQGEWRKTPKAARAEGLTVIGADRARQPVGAKCLLAGNSRLSIGATPQSLASRNGWWHRSGGTDNTAHRCPCETGL